MAKGIHVDVFITREDNSGVSPELMERVVRKVTALLIRLGCVPHGTWRLGDPPEVEDELGL